MIKQKALLCSIFVFLLSTFTINADNNLTELPNDFRPECYEYYTKIGKNILNNDETYKILTNKKVSVITSGGKLLPFKEYSENHGKSEYYKNFEFLNDNNKKTYIEIDTRNKKEFLVELINNTVQNGFIFIMDIDSKYYNTNIYISENGDIYDKVSAYNVEDYSFKYLKIKFDSNSSYNEIIKIRELSFNNKSASYLIKNIENNDIEIYSNFSCKGEENIYSNSYDNFEIDVNTKNLKVNLNKNPIQNFLSKKDSDNDWIEDDNDNCINIYNPSQKDSSGNGSGDACSDDDLDGIIGYYDNCPSIYNPGQKDLNRDGVGYVCEFDKDGDKIPDGIDNCINKSNKDQLDSDFDGIGNACDNCELYNPTQVDKNSNLEGDICEEMDEKIKNNDKDNDRIMDNIDNCPNNYNPNQEDTDKDGVGDICDNCKELQNTKQIDLNTNSIGDMCEDSDNDSFIGYRDNCMNISNKLQKDDDNDGIGNVCEDDDNDDIFFINDNCPFEYNPDQKDLDNDNIGDTCDESDDRYLETNKSFFMLILALATIVFMIMIYTLIQKINKK